MRIQVFAFMLSISFTSHSQSKVVDVGKNDVQISASMFYVVSGSPISNTKYVKVVEGSPYFNEGWMKRNTIGGLTATPGAPPGNVISGNGGGGLAL